MRLSSRPKPWLCTLNVACSRALPSDALGPLPCCLNRLSLDAYAMYPLNLYAVSTSSLLQHLYYNAKDCRSERT